MCRTNLISLEKLRKIDLHNLQNFTIDVASDPAKKDYLSSLKILRCLPKKRISCLAEYRNTKVFAKIYFGSKRAKKNWLKEKIGIKFLTDKNILTPSLIAHFIVSDSIYVLLLRYVEHAISFQQKWLRCGQQQQMQLLTQLLVLVAEHHNKNIIQLDCHLDNFIFSANKLYTLDGAEIIFMQSLSDKVAVNNLALLLAQFYPTNDGNIEAAIAIYLRHRNSSNNIKNIDRIKQLIQKNRKQRRNKFIKKINRECSVFVARKTWRHSFVCVRDYYGKLKDFIELPDFHCQQGIIIKDGNTCTVFKLNFQGMDVLVKRYNIKSWHYQLVRLLCSSRAMKSWNNAHLLSFYGVETPKPIALIENNFMGFKGKAYLITQYLDAEGCSNYFLNQSNQKKNKIIVANKITNLFKKLSDLLIAHGDLKASNILLHEEQPYLIDLDSMRQYCNYIFYARARRKDCQRFAENWKNNKTIASYFE